MQEFFILNLESEIAKLQGRLEGYRAMKKRGYVSAEKFSTAKKEILKFMGQLQDLISRYENQ